MQIVVAGATSGTGNAVVQRLAAKFGAENIVCLIRPTSQTTILETLRVRMVIGDVTDPGSLRKVLSPDTVYLDMTNPRCYDALVPAVKECGVERTFFVTTTGIFSRFHSCSDIYKRAEELVKNSGFVYTILRPSMIYGHLRDRNMGKLITVLTRYPVFPLINGGRSLMQPVFVDDLADGIVSAIGNSKTEYKEYNLAGPAQMSYNNIIDAILTKLGRRVLKMNINISLAYYLAYACQWIPHFPIKAEQVLRLREDKVFDIKDAVAGLDYRPRSFYEGISREIDEMRKANLLPYDKAQ